jgi:diguanylate cyclase (GGDEF)-like protein
MPAHDENGNAVTDREFEHSLVAAIHEASPDGILVVDGDDTIVSHNRRLLAVWDIDPATVPGAREGDLAGLPDHRLLSRAMDKVADQAGFLQRIHELYADPSLEDLSEIELTDGRTLERHSRALWNAAGRYLGRVWFFRDITQRKQNERRLEALSNRDSLTGVPNRRHFFERAVEELARCRRFGHELAVLLIDLDRFKTINDRWGHAAGDRVLQHFARCAEAVLRRGDQLARLGGEEFVVLVPETGQEGAVALAERLRESVAGQEVVQDGQVVRYTVSIGVAVLGPGDDAVDGVLQRADVALYAAKDGGRDRVRLAGASG